MNRATVANFLMLKNSLCGFLRKQRRNFRNLSFIKPQRIELQQNATQHFLWFKLTETEECIGNIGSFKNVDKDCLKFKSIVALYI